MSRRPPPSGDTAMGSNFHKLVARFASLYKNELKNNEPRAISHLEGDLRFLGRRLRSRLEKARIDSHFSSLLAGGRRGRVRARRRYAERRRDTSYRQLSGQGTLFGRIASGSGSSSVS